MDITTKFTAGDTAYSLLNNKIQGFTVDSIEIFVTNLETTITNNCTLNNVQYRILDENSAKTVADLLILLQTQFEA